MSEARAGGTVGRLGLGCAPLGNLFTAVSDHDAEATVHTAWECGIRYFDTAPLYGHGRSEMRLGQALAGRPRDDFVLSTKVGRVLKPVTEHAPTIFRNLPPVDPVFDFSRDGVLRSIEESLERLATDRIDVVHVHDPDAHEAEALDGAFPALLELRDQGVIRQVGAGMNQWEMLERFVDRIDLDCVLLAGRYTLLDRSGERLLEHCAQRQVGVVLGGVFNSGLLVHPEPGSTFDYETAPPPLLERARGLAALCTDLGCELPAAALQFALRHPAVSRVLVGARTAGEIEHDVALAIDPIGPEAWAALDAARGEWSRSDQ